MVEGVEEDWHVPVIVGDKTLEVCVFGAFVEELIHSIVFVVWDVDH